MDFFPSILDINKHIPTIAFGSKKFVSHVRNKAEFLKFIKNTKIGEILNEEKQSQLFDDYTGYYDFIQKLTKWASWYIYDRKKENRPPIPESDDQIIDQWRKNVFQFYELLLISESLYEKILYTQLLNDHLWNPRFDPRNPKIQEFFKYKISLLTGNKPAIKDDEDKIYIEDEDTQSLLSYLQETNLINLFNKISMDYRELIESSEVDFDKIKKQIAKLKLLETILETDIIFSNKSINKNDFFNYTILLRCTKKKLNECERFIKSHEQNFSVKDFFENTNLYESCSIEYRHLNLYKQNLSEMMEV